MFPLIFFLLFPFFQLSQCQIEYKLIGNDQWIDVENEMLIEMDFFSERENYERRLVHPELTFYLGFIDIEFLERDSSCDGQLRIYVPGYRENYINCHPTTKNQFYLSRRRTDRYRYKAIETSGGHDEMRISGRNVRFTAIVSTRSSLDGVGCSNTTIGGVRDSNGGGNSLFVVYSFPPDQSTETGVISLTNPPVNFIQLSGNESGEIIAFSDFYWSTPSNYCGNLLPIADVPSCNADMPDTCQWTSTVSPSEYDLTPDFTGNTFKVAGSIAVFETRSNTLYLESICVNVMYLSKGTSILKAYVRQKDEREGQQFILTSEMKPTENLRNQKIVGNLPENLKGAPVQVVIQISVRNEHPVYIKRIYGCNPYLKEDRYEVPDINRYKNSKITYAYKGFDINNPGTKYVALPYLLKELEQNESCLNGGLQDGRNCVCPAGFIGDHCEIGCGENKFGPNCESQCSFNEYKCQGKIICQPNLGCNCAPGWRGRHCNLGCTDGWYGGGCKFRCGHCQNSSPCDKFTGHCSMDCEPGYVPPNCQKKYTYVAEKPVASEIDYNSAVLTIDLRSNTYSDIRFFVFQYRNISADTFSWYKTTLKKWPDSGNIKERLQHLKAGCKYEARIVVFNEDMASYQGYDLPSVRFETLCIENELNITGDATEQEIHLRWKGLSEDVNRCDSNHYEVQILLGSVWKSMIIQHGNITFGSLLPSTKYIIRVRENRENSRFYFKTVTTLRNISGTVNGLGLEAERPHSIELYWDGDANGDSQSYLIKYQCLMVLSSEEDCEDDNGIRSVKRNKIIIEGLSPFRKYQFSVKELPGLEHSTVIATTKAAVPTLIPKLQTVTSSNSSINVSWSPPDNCSECNGIIIGYLVKVLDDENNTVILEETTQTTYMTTRLAPGTLYKFYIYLVNTEGKSTVPLIVEGVTKSTVPTAVVDLVAYKTGRREVGLRWGRPRHVFGDLLGFSIDKLLMEPTPCTAWPSEYCHTMTNLSPDTAYNFSVCARNAELHEDGVCSFISATTTEKAPEEPLNLKVFNETENSISISWEPPRLFNGVLRSFMIKVEQTESFNLTDCCQEHPKIEIRVKKELPRYESQISGLSGGSKFAVSVMGETVWLGPAARVSGCTRPPTPQQPNPPTTIIHSSDNTTIPLTWPHHSPTSNDPTSLTLIKDNLVLVLPASNSTPMNESVWDEEDLKILVDKKFPGQRYYLGTHYKGDGEYVEVGGLLSGHSYRLALLTVAEYCRLYAIAVTTSLEFTAP